MKRRRRTPLHERIAHIRLRIAPNFGKPAPDALAEAIRTGGEQNA
jgi:hypothetical protein